MFKHTGYYNYATAVPTPLDWGDQSRCFQLFFDVLYDVTVNMTMVRRRIGQYFILANTRQYASICANMCQYAPIRVNILLVKYTCFQPICANTSMRQYASICANILNQRVDLHSCSCHVCPTEQRVATG